MSTILAKGGFPVLPLSPSAQVSTPDLPVSDVPASPSVIPLTPGPGPTHTHHCRSLREVKLQEQAGRVKRDTDVQSAAVPPAKAGNVRRRYPATADAEKADIALQKRLVNGLNTGKADEKANPKKSSVAPFIEMYNQAVNEPSVQAWFRSQALKPETIRVFNDCVVGVVVRDGKETFQRFSATDGSGWGQVSQTITALQQVLSPSNLGLPATGGANAIGRDVLLDFYGVKPPESEKSAHHLGKHLKNNGWPRITAARRDEWQRQFKELARRREDSAVRTRVVEQFRSQFTGEPDTNVLHLDDQNVKVDPGSSLDQRSKKPRQLFLQFLESATFQAFLKKAGYDLPGSEFRMPEFRLSEGDLQMRNLAGDWVSMQQAFDDEVERASRHDDAEGTAARKMNEAYDQLVKMSKKTGNALYSTRTYDARQVLAFYAPDVPKTVGQLRATITWLPERTGPIHDRAPNTFASSKVSQIVDRLIAYNFKDDRDARIAYANEPTELYKRNHPFSTSRLFSAEGARMLLSLIPFVGAIADLVEGKTEDGAKGLVIDFLSFFATGGWSGLKAFGKGLKMLIPFSGTPFTVAALKGGVTYIRGLFNPLEAIPGIFRGGINSAKGLGKVANGVPVHIGSNIYLPVTTFEQWRWLSGASESVVGNRGKNFPGARKGFSGSQEVLAVQKNGSWYAINPVSHKPEGTPLENFEPAPV